MPLPDFRLIRLLPLAALVLTACSVTTPKGPGKSPDSPQWRQHQQDVRNLNQYQTRGAFAYISDQQKVYARFFWQQTGQDRYRLLLTNPLGSTAKGPGKSPDSPQWRQHQQDVRNLNQYQTRGAFAYISDQQKVYARFFWQQTGQDRYRLLLTNPLGSTELELNAQPGNVQLVDNKGQRYTADDAEEMIGKLTGMPIPLNSLRQWILGLPGDATDYKLDDQYRLSEITYSQNGKNWKVVYGGYDTKTQPAMPANMELTDGGQRIKLKMDNWIVK